MGKYKWDHHARLEPTLLAYKYSAASSPPVAVNNNMAYGSFCGNKND
jgi:hypothetical protein